MAKVQPRNQTRPGDAKATLTRSVEEISELLASGEYDFDELIRKILAAIYYGAGCHRVLLCRCLEAQQTVKARYAVGKKVKALLKQFQFPLDGTSSMFSRAVQTGKDIIVGDLPAHSIQEPVPAWYKPLEPADSFALLPFKASGRVGGFIYLDHPQPHYLDQLSAEQFELLGKLRDLASQAYEARSQ
jgi:GAF domain-containing protein